MKKVLSVAIMAAIVISMIGCGGGSSRTTTTSVDAGRLVYGTDWSPRDLNRIANKMASSISQARWFRRAVARRVRWILANEMANDTDEHINTRVIMEKVRTKLINQHNARFIDDQALTDILRQQRLQQSDLFNRDTVVKVGRLSGARLILRGRISNMRRRAGLTTANMFQITLQAVDMQTADIRWTDDAQIARITRRGRYR